MGTRVKVTCSAPASSEVKEIIKLFQIIITFYQLEFNGTHTRALTHACIRLVNTIVFEEVRFVDLIVRARLLSYSDHEATFVSTSSHLITA